MRHSGRWKTSGGVETDLELWNRFGEGLGWTYSHGEGVPKDYAEAAHWYHRAAQQGYAKAQFNLGVMYRRGEGVQQDYVEAVRWCEKAAEQGDPQALHTLSLLKPRSSIPRKGEYFWILVGFPVGVLFSLDFLIPRRKHFDLRQAAVTTLGLILLSGAALNLYAITHDDMQYSSWDITFRAAREFLALGMFLACSVIILTHRRRSQVQPKV